jgi:hypothetical protein
MTPVDRSGRPGPVRGVPSVAYCLTLVCRSAAGESAGVSSIGNQSELPGGI